MWVYINDILIFSKNVGIINDTSIQYTSYCSNTSCFPASNFLRSSSHEFLFCGYTIDKDGVHMKAEKIKVILDWPAPSTIHEVRQFIGLCGFYQQFVDGFKAVAAPPSAMFKAEFEWEWTAVPCLQQAESSNGQCETSECYQPPTAVPSVRGYFEGWHRG